MELNENKQYKGHFYLKLFKKNVLTVYRHFLFSVDLMAQDSFCEKDGLNIVELNDDILDRCNNSYFCVGEIKENLKKDNCSGFALLDGPSVIGYVTFCFPPFKTSQYRIVHCDCYIENIWIDSNRRGNHLSIYLFNYCFDHLLKKGFKNVLFVVRRNNIPMLKTIKHIKANFVKKLCSIRFCGLRIWCPKI